MKKLTLTAFATTLGLWVAAVEVAIWTSSDIATAGALAITGVATLILGLILAAYLDLR